MSRRANTASPIWKFDDGTKLGVNATNNRALVAGYGADSDDMDRQGDPAHPRRDRIPGRTQESVPVNPISPPIERKPAPPKPKSENGKRGDMDDEIPF